MEEKRRTRSTIDQLDNSSLTITLSETDMTKNKMRSISKLHIYDLNSSVILLTAFGDLFINI